METILDLHRVVGELDDPTFLRLCQDNAHLHFERDPAGRLVMNPPLGGEGASRELDVASRLGGLEPPHPRRTRLLLTGPLSAPSGALRGPMPPGWLPPAATPCPRQSGEASLHWRRIS
jgi:hypothetical protein